MRYLIFPVVLLFAASVYGFRDQTAATQAESVNHVLGDISFIRTFGHGPAGASEGLRIATHLAYVEDLLRSRNVSTLPTELRSRRNQLLDLLRDYRKAGIFPKNESGAGRRLPCFIDASGNICAVGYLVEQTAGRSAAEAINRNYQYAEVRAMNDPALDKWIEGSGLTREEAAMIQPTYGVTQRKNYQIPKKYAVSSAAMSGINLSLSAINGIGMMNGSGTRIMLPAIGLASGIGQVLLGVVNYPKTEENWQGIEYVNKGQQTLSMINIGLGTAGIILSAWNLAARRSPVDRRTTWNAYPYSTGSNHSGLAVSMTRRF